MWNRADRRQEDRGGGVVTDRVDLLQRRAVQHYQVGTTHRWVACLAALRIVGTRQPGATQTLASKLSLSVSQVENLARAGWTYLVLRPLDPRVPQWRRQLTTSHFAALGDAMHRYEISPQDILIDLETAAHHHASVASLSSYLEGHYGGRVRDWQDKLDRARSRLIELCEDYSVPESVRTLTLDYLEAVRLEAEGWLR